MTERLYYDDALLTAFDGRVTQCVQTRDGWKIALDRSAFYPESGGQPGDRGMLTGSQGERVPVMDTQCDDEGEVWHYCPEPLAVGCPVHGEIDWERRRDHMEQHGGEHLLAGAVWKLLRGTTIGLHTGREDATIDVSMPEGRCHLTDEETQELESTVNAWIRMDVPVRCWFPGEEELKTVPLRKPPAVKTHIRVVAYGDFEYCACGGTHPPRSGMIGQMKILSVTPSKGKARIRFVCGGRAEAWFRRLYALGRQCAQTLSCGMETLPEALVKLMEENAALKRKAETQNRLLAEQWIRESEQNARELANGGSALYLELPWTDRQLPIDCVSRLIGKEKRIVLCVSDQREDLPFILAASQDVSLSLSDLIRGAEGIRGGGRGNFLQGKIRDRETVERLLKKIESLPSPERE